MRAYEIIVENLSFRIRRMPDDIYQAVNGKEVLGWAQVDIHRANDPEDVRRIFRSNVKEKYRRQGIATKLYDMIERDLKKKGLRLEPQKGGLLSSDAASFWANRQKQD